MALVEILLRLSRPQRPTTILNAAAQRQPTRSSPTLPPRLTMIPNADAPRPLTFRPILAAQEAPAMVVLAMEVQVMVVQVAMALRVALLKPQAVQVVPTVQADPMAQEAPATLAQLLPLSRRRSRSMSLSLSARAETAEMADLPAHNQLLSQPAATHLASWAPPAQSEAVLEPLCQRVRASSTRDTTTINFRRGK